MVHVTKMGPQPQDATCLTCQHTFKAEQQQDLHRRLTLHLTCKAHIFNCWLERLDAQQQSLLAPTLRPVDPLFADVCQPCGGERVSDLYAHAATRMHQDNAAAAEDFAAHCDLREVCPVTCSTQDVCFYLELHHSQTASRRGGTLRINRVLNVVSRMHDPVQGQELLAVPEVLMKCAVRELLLCAMYTYFLYVPFQMTL